MIILLITFLAISLAANVLAVSLLIRASRRLLQFDDIMQALTPELEAYAFDLKKMSSGDLLLDHPEIVTFHKRNQRALKTVESIVEAVTSVTPKRDKLAPVKETWDKFYE